MHIDIHFAGHLDPTVNLVVPGQQWLHDHYHKPYHRESGFIMIAVPGRQWRNFDAVLIIIMTSIIMIQKKLLLLEDDHFHYQGPNHHDFCCRATVEDL